MSNANKIQIGILAIIALMVAYYVFSSKSGDSVKDAAAQRIDAPAANNPTNPNTPPADAPPPGPKTTIKFAEEEYNFGTVPEGEKVQHVYKFTNTGTNPLTITEAKGSCGCTVPNFDKEPIPPGGKGEIRVEFDSKGKPGNQSKTVTVKANTDPYITTLKITGQVTPDPNKPKAEATPGQPTITPVLPQSGAVKTK